MDRNTRESLKGTGYERVLRGFAGLILFGLLSAGPSAGAAGGVQAPVSLEGAWQDPAEPGHLLGFNGGKINESQGGRIVRVTKLLNVQGARLQVCEFGEDAYPEARVEGDRLAWRESPEGPVTEFHRLPVWPAALDLKPLRLPEPKPLPLSRVMEIQSELYRRLKQDQATIRRKGTKIPGMALDSAALHQIQVSGENTAYLRSLVLEVGWIDVLRFSYPTAVAAFLIVQHSMDLPLMLAAIPEIEKSTGPMGLIGDDYPLLVDRTRLLQGERQIYGTQVGRQADGKPLVLPIVDRQNLDEIRGILGMIPPTALEYLRVLGGDDQVRFSEACQEAPTSTAVQTLRQHGRPGVVGCCVDRGQHWERYGTAIRSRKAR